MNNCTIVATLRVRAVRSGPRSERVCACGSGGGGGRTTPGVPRRSEHIPSPASRRQGASRSVPIGCSTPLWLARGRGEQGAGSCARGQVDRLSASRGTSTLETAPRTLRHPAAPGRHAILKYRSIIFCSSQSVRWSVWVVFAGRTGVRVRAHGPLALGVRPGGRLGSQVVPSHEVHVRAAPPSPGPVGGPPSPPSSPSPAKGPRHRTQGRAPHVESAGGRQGMDATRRRRADQVSLNIIIYYINSKSKKTYVVQCANIQRTTKNSDWEFINFWQNNPHPCALVSGNYLIVKI